jgi:hypothetical protein
LVQSISIQLCLLAVPHMEVFHPKEILRCVFLRLDVTFRALAESFSKIGCYDWTEIDFMFRTLIGTCGSGSYTVGPRSRFLRLHFIHFY